MAKGTQTWSRRKLLKYSAVTVLVVLLLAEGITRLLFYGKYHGLGTSVFIQGSPLQEEDPATVFNNRAFYVDFDKRWQYNQEGMKSRCGDYRMPEKKANELWVLLLGGSAMEGMGSNKEGGWLDITGITDHPYTETIAFYLQNGLQWMCPGRRIRVFNAAVSGFTLEQSVANYRRLSGRYDFDWVISMDGVNECDTLDSDAEESERAFSRRYWESFPFHRWPLKGILPITQHSAFFNLLKQEVYRVRMNARLRENETGGFPERKFWAAQPAAPLLFASGDVRVASSVGAFLREERDFAAELETGGKNYLLLVQPYLAFKDTANCSKEEIALDRYLRQEMNDRYKQAFLRAVGDSLRNMGERHIQGMPEVLTWRDWTFVDYCHFTKMASEKIAGRLARYIASDGKVPVFR
jgi:hypothetical protein